VAEVELVDGGLLLDADPAWSEAINAVLGMKADCREARLALSSL
jgi:hypothetical protein